MHRVIFSRREEESMMSTHGSAASAPGARLWQDARVPSPALSRLVKATMAAVVTLCLVQPTSAQQQSDAFAVRYTGTLKKINDTGEIRIGYRENSPPFAFLDAQRKPLGYSLDLCEIVVEEIAAELGKDIRVIRRPVTPENRFDLVTSGEVDLECGSTTNNLERRKSMAFSPTMFVTGTKLLVRRGSGILNFRDLAGKTVVLTRGTVHETAIPKLAQRQNIPIKFAFGSDHGESFQLLATGKAEAFANDDVQLYGMVAEKKAAADFRVVGDFLTYADYALMFRKDDPEFAEIVERAFHKLAGSREIVAIYERWFQKPLPSGVRLNLPMSPHLEELFRVQGLPSD
jgi:glutamate/aspartate transport system substrate-binding protein